MLSSSLPLIGALRRRLRRTVLRHRRLLALVLTAVAVATGLGAVRPPPPATVAVVVAAHDLPAGAVLGPDDVDTARLPPGAMPSGVAAAPVGRILAAPVRRGEPITDVRLVGPTLTTAAPGRVALPVRLTDAQSVDLLTPGDRIDLLVTEASSGRTTEVAIGVVVLAVPPVTASASTVTNGLPGRLVIVATPADQVTSVTSAGVRGFLSFAYAR